MRENAIGSAWIVSEEPTNAPPAVGTVTNGYLSTGWSTGPVRIFNQRGYLKLALKYILVTMGTCVLAETGLGWGQHLATDLTPAAQFTQRQTATLAPILVTAKRRMHGLMMAMMTVTMNSVCLSCKVKTNALLLINLESIGFMSDRASALAAVQLICNIWTWGSFQPA